MTGALFVVSIVSLLTAAAITLAVAGFVLQRVQRYVELAEERIEALREGQEQLLRFLKQEHRAGIGMRELETSRSVENDSEIGFSRKDESPSTSENTERRIRQLESGIQALRESRQDAKVLEKVSSLDIEGTFVGLPTDQETLFDEQTAPKDTPEQEDDTRTGWPAKATEPEHTADSSDHRDRVVKRLHPDDARRYSWNNTPAKKMFSEHYDRYLENYSGYVELAEEIYRVWCGDEISSDYPAQQECKQKLRRAKDGIARTTTRLDILEQYNPELASDRRISHRAEIAQNHAELEKKLSGMTDS